MKNHSITEKKVGKEILQKEVRERTMVFKMAKKEKTRSILTVSKKTGK